MADEWLASWGSFTSIWGEKGIDHSARIYGTVAVVEQEHERMGVQR
jgi:hypothetical protein